MARSLLALLPCLLSVLIGLRFLEWMSADNDGIEPFSDAVTYLAAGERLADGHPLYELSAGDRQVLRVIGTSDAPLLSPPPIAVIWRLIVAIPFGFQAWIVACWVSLLGTTFLLARQTGLPGMIVASMLSPGIGEQLAACNLAAFFPMLLSIAWVSQSPEARGAIIGALAALKLAPGSLVGWILGTQRSGLAWFGLAVAVSAAVSILGASVSVIPEYLGVVARGIGPSWLSMSSLTGISWLSPAVLVGGTILAAGLGRWPALSFCVGILAAVFGTPALYLSGLVTVLAVLAPVAWPAESGHELDRPIRSLAGSVGWPARFAYARVPRSRRR
jgi:hypothetical protein